MAEEDLRRRVRHDIGRPVSEKLWQLAKDAELVRPAMRSTRETAYGDLVEWIREIFEATSEPQVRESRGALDDAIPRVFRERAEALSRIAADHAREDPAVIGFRMRAFGSPGRLKAVDVAKLLTSTAAVTFPIDSLAISWDDQGRLVVGPPAAGTELVLGDWARDHLDYQLAGGGVHQWMAFREGSLIDQLRIAAQELVAHYPWNMASAAAFILEGVRPSARPLALKLVQQPAEGDNRPARTMLTIDIDMWVPAVVLMESYRRIQRQVLQGHNRPISGRSILLVRFVTDVRMADPPVSWQKLLDCWNEYAPISWRYDDRRYFRLAYLRAKHSLLFPRLRRLKKLPRLP